MSFLFDPLIYELLRSVLLMENPIIKSVVRMLISSLCLEVAAFASAMLTRIHHSHLLRSTVASPLCVTVHSFLPRSCEGQRLFALTVNTLNG